MKIPVRVRVAAYILRQQHSGQFQLLLFRHPNCSEAPLQIPAGGAKTNELLEAALYREIWEEAGLKQVQTIRKLGVAEWYWRSPKPLISQTHCYLLQAASETADRWPHTVQGADLDAGLSLCYFWMRPSPEFRLHGSLGNFLTPEAIPELYGNPVI